MKTFKEHISEESPIMSVGSHTIAGLEPDVPPVPAGVTTGSKMLRRKKFAGKQVFVVDPNTYYKSILGKTKNEHYEKYLSDCDIGEEIRNFGRRYWDQSIILQNEKTGAMAYLKHGKRHNSK